MLVKFLKKNYWCGLVLNQTHLDELKHIYFLQFKSYSSKYLHLRDIYSVRGIKSAEYKNLYIAHLQFWLLGVDTNLWGH